MDIYLSPRIHLRRLHPIRAAALIRVALRDSDHLPVGGLQVEVVLAVLASEGLEGAFAAGVLAHGGDAVFGRGFGLVAFGRKDGLAVPGYEAEAKFAVLAGVELKLGHERRGEAFLGGDWIRHIK